MRTLDDVYGAEQDRFPLEQDLRLKPAILRWDDSDAGRARLPDWLFEPNRDPYAPGASA